MIAIQKIEVGHTYEVGKHGVDRIDIDEDGRIAVHRNGTIVYFVAVEGQTRLQEQVTYGANRVDHPWAKIPNAPWAKIPNDSTVKGQLAYSESLYPEHVKLRSITFARAASLDLFMKWLMGNGHIADGWRIQLHGPWHLLEVVWEYLQSCGSINLEALDREREQMADRGHVFDMTPPRQP